MLNNRKNKMSDAIRNVTIKLGLEAGDISLVDDLRNAMKGLQDLTRGNQDMLEENRKLYGSIGDMIRANDERMGSWATKTQESTKSISEAVRETSVLGAMSKMSAQELAKQTADMLGPLDAYISRFGSAPIAAKEARDEIGRIMAEMREQGAVFSSGDQMNAENAVTAEIDRLWSEMYGKRQELATQDFANQQAIAARERELYAGTADFQTGLIAELQQQRMEAQERQRSQQRITADEIKSSMESVAETSRRESEERRREIAAVADAQRTADADSVKSKQDYADTSREATEAISEQERQAQERTRAEQRITADEAKQHLTALSQFIEQQNTTQRAEITRTSDLQKAASEQAVQDKQRELQSIESITAAVQRAVEAGSVQTGNSLADEIIRIGRESQNIEQAYAAVEKLAAELDNARSGSGEIIRVGDTVSNVEQLREAVRQVFDASNSLAKGLSGATIAMSQLVKSGGELMTVADGLPVITERIQGLTTVLSTADFGSIQWRFPEQLSETETGISKVIDETRDWKEQLGGLSLREFTNQVIEQIGPLEKHIEYWGELERGIDRAEEKAFRVMDKMIPKTQTIPKDAELSVYAEIQDRMNQLWENGYRERMRLRNEEHRKEMERIEERKRLREDESARLRKEAEEASNRIPKIYAGMSREGLGAELMNKVGPLEAYIQKWGSLGEATREAQDAVSRAYKDMQSKGAAFNPQDEFIAQQQVTDELYDLWKNVYERKMRLAEQDAIYQQQFAAQEKQNKMQLAASEQSLAEEIARMQREQRAEMLQQQKQSVAAQEENNRKLSEALQVQHQRELEQIAATAAAQRQADTERAERQAALIQQTEGFFAAVREAQSQTGKATGMESVAEAIARIGKESASLQEAYAAVDQLQKKLEETRQEGGSVLSVGESVREVETLKEAVKQVYEASNSRTLFEQAVDSITEAQEETKAWEAAIQPIAERYREAAASAKTAEEAAAIGRKLGEELVKIGEQRGQILSVADAINTVAQAEQAGVRAFVDAQKEREAATKQESISAAYANQQWSQGIALITRSTASLGSFMTVVRGFAKGNDDLEDFVKSFAKVQLTLQGIRSSQKFLTDLQNGLNSVAASGSRVSAMAGGLSGILGKAHPVLMGLTAAWTGLQLVQEMWGDSNESLAEQANERYESMQQALQRIREEHERVNEQIQKEIDLRELASRSLEQEAEAKRMQESGPLTKEEVEEKSGRRISEAQKGLREELLTAFNVAASDAKKRLGVEDKKTGKYTVTEEKDGKPVSRVLSDKEANSILQEIASIREAESRVKKDRDGISQEEAASLKGFFVGMSPDARAEIGKSIQDARAEELAAYAEQKRGYESIGNEYGRERDQFAKEAGKSFGMIEESERFAANRRSMDSDQFAKQEFDFAEQNAEMALKMGIGSRDAVNDYAGFARSQGLISAKDIEMAEKMSMGDTQQLFNMLQDRIADRGEFTEEERAKIEKQTQAAEESADAARRAAESLDRASAALNEQLQKLAEHAAMVDRALANSAVGR